MLLLLFLDFISISHTYYDFCAIHSIHCFARIIMTRRNATNYFSCIYLFSPMLICNLHKYIYISFTYYCRARRKIHEMTTFHYIYFCHWTYVWFDVISLFLYLLHLRFIIFPFHSLCLLLIEHHLMHELRTIKLQCYFTHLAEITDGFRRFDTDRLANTTHHYLLILTRRAPLADYTFDDDSDYADFCAS